MHFNYSKSLFHLFCFLLSGSTLAQIYCPTEERFKGPVNFVKESVFELPERHINYNRSADDSDSLRLMQESLSEVKNGLIIKKEIFDACSCKVTYSNDGHLLEKSTFNEYGKLDTKFVNTWNSNQIIRTDHYNTEDHFYSSTLILRDSIKRTALSKEVFENHEENVIYTTYNEHNQPLISYHLDSLGSKKIFAEYNYDEFSRLLTTHIWNSDSTYDQHFISYYDSLNRTEKRDWYLRSGQFMGSDSIVYDKNSNIIYERTYDFINRQWSNCAYEIQTDQYLNILKKETWLIEDSGRILISQVVRSYIYEK